MKNCTIVLAFLLLLPCFVFAKYMAVLETLSPNDLLTRQERLYLTDILRGQAVSTLPAEQNWTIMTRENINVMLPPGKTIEDCEGSCLAETGRNIAADYVAQARISQFGKSLAISAELYETASSKLVASFAGKGESVDDIEKIIRDQSPEFFKKARGSSGFGYVNANGSFSFQVAQKFIVNISSNPAGAIPTIDGKAVPQCTSTPCTIQLAAGEHRLILLKERFEDLDTVVNITENNQTLNLTLSSNIGFLVFAPQIQEKFRDKPVSVFIDGAKALLGLNVLVPGIHTARIGHACFDPVEFTFTIQKGETQTMSDTLVRGIGGLELEVVKNGVPQAVPVFIDGIQVESTPFAREVPLCAKVEIEYAGVRKNIPVDLKWHEVTKKVYNIEDKPKTVTDTLRQKADVAYAELEDEKVSAKKVEEQPIVQADSVKSKSIWGGAILGLIYNDFYGTHLGLNDVKNETGYSHSVEGSDDLLSSFWGVGFKLGFGGLFIAADYLSFHGELGLAFRQGSGKTNVVVTLSGDDKVNNKSDLEIEYSASQLNIDIPILARVSLPKALYFEAGPMMSFNVYSKSKSKIRDFFDTKTYEAKSDLKAFEFDIATGLGISRSIGKSILDFNLRMVFGLTRIGDGKDSPKTLQGQLNVTYWFLQGKM